MFHDLDSTIAELLHRELPPNVVEQVSISFVTPDGGFPPQSVALPAVNLFLYDIQENRDLRNPEADIMRQVDGRVIRIPPPVRVDCHYLVTAWAKAGTHPDQDEHRLLGDVLQVLLRHREIPKEVLVGSMKDQCRPLRGEALKNSQQHTRGDFWQALGGKPKAAFSYVVTMSIAEPAEDAGVVVSVARA